MIDADASEAASDSKLMRSGRLNLIDVEWAATVHLKGRKFSLPPRDADFPGGCADLESSRAWSKK
jgi:hypothetical protein